MEKTRFLVYVNKVLYILKCCKFPNNDQMLSELKKKYHTLRKKAFISFLDTKVVPYIKRNVSKEKIYEYNDNFEKNKDKLGYKELFDPDYLMDYLIKTYGDVDVYARNHLFEYEDDEILAVLNTKKAKEYFKYDDMYTFYYTYKCVFSSTVIDYVTKQEIDVLKFINSEDAYLKSEKEINEVVANYGIFDMNMSNDINYVYIGDIVGTSYINRKTNILNTLANYFEYNGDSYHSRANGLLEYDNGKSLVEGLLSRGLEREPIKLNEVEKDIFIVSTNGMHRYSMLRFHYLKDKLNGMSEDELREIYTIPVYIGYSVNYIKTYSNYLLSKLDPNFDRINSFQEYTLKYKNGKKIDLTDDILLDIVRETISKSKLNDEIEELIDKYTSFKEYMNLLLEKGVKYGV